MATTIIQKPLYTQLPVGQVVIFTTKNDSIVYGQQSVKFIAEVHISNTTSPNPNTTNDLVGTFKTTPNGAGVGIFDLSPVIESFVSADNLANSASNYQYKKQDKTEFPNLPIHLIDKYSGSKNLNRWLVIRFQVEYLDTVSGSSTFGQIITEQKRDSKIYNLFNGYLKENDIRRVKFNTGDFGYNLGEFYFIENNARKFLSNAPLLQYANKEDYGTVALNMTNPITKGSAANPNSAGTVGVKIFYYSSDGLVISSETVTHTLPNGGFSYANANAYAQYLYLGIFPANLRGWSNMFANLINLGTVSFYRFRVVTGAGVTMSSTYRININCPTLKGYKPVRLCWMNQWGTWDYYTFTLKSSVSISTKQSKYQQLAGTWNQELYEINGFKGGKKTFRVNGKEIIKMNTDYISELDSDWFEELINSPEVYLLDGFQNDPGFGSQAQSVLNNYVTPVVLKTSKWTKKTKANDKLIQYTFEIEKSKTLKTQSI